MSIGRKISFKGNIADLHFNEQLFSFLSITSARSVMPTEMGLWWRGRFEPLRHWWFSRWNRRL